MAISNKASRALTIVVATVIIIVAIFSTYLFYRQARLKIEGSAIEKISTIAETIDPEMIYALRGDLSEDNAVYIREKAEFDKIIHLNPKFVFLYLMGVEEYGKSMVFYIDSDTSDDQARPGDIYKDTTQKMWRTIDTGQPQFDDLYDGEDTDDWGTWISAYAPVKDADGQVIALLGVDIDQNKFIADIIIQTSPPILISLFFISILFFYRRGIKKEHRQLEREKELLSVASHEVRSPMVSIKWVLDDVLSREDGLSEYNRGLISAVADNSGKIIASINGILESTPNWGSGNRGKERIRMLDLFNDIVDRLCLVAKEHRTVVRIDESLTDSVIVKGSTKSLNHAFYNILNNALKYNTPDTEVTISYAHANHIDYFRIGDHGPGVKPEDREKIFEGRYRTEEAVKSGQSGTGLGLYFVRKIITDHRGKIYVDPSYEVGTAFIVELPE
jgi:signal transduction histidine kinase